MVHTYNSGLHSIAGHTNGVVTPDYGLPVSELTVICKNLHASY